MPMPKGAVMVKSCINDSRNCVAKKSNQDHPAQHSSQQLHPGTMAVDAEER
jgi:hypothetical protein